MRYLKIILSTLTLLGLAGCLTGCLEQYNPREDWATFRKERETAHENQLQLNDDGSKPDINQVREDAKAALAGGGAGGIAKKYETFCVSCHGAKGDGMGLAGAALNPKPRNFTDTSWWDAGNGKKKERLYAVIKLGGAGTDYGVAATMSAWGGALSDDEITEMVAYLEEAFKGK